MASSDPDEEQGVTSMLTDRTEVRKDPDEEQGVIMTTDRTQVIGRKVPDEEQGVTMLTDQAEVLERKDPDEEQGVALSSVITEIIDTKDPDLVEQNEPSDVGEPVGHSATMAEQVSCHNKELPGSEKSSLDSPESPWIPKMVISCMLREMDVSVSQEFLRNILTNIEFRFGEVEKRRTGLTVVNLYFPNRKQSDRANYLLGVEKKKGTALRGFSETEIVSPSKVIYQLKSKALHPLHEHEKKIDKYRQEISHCLKPQKKVVKKRFQERAVLEQKLLELDKQRDEFLTFMDGMEKKLLSLRGECLECEKAVTSIRKEFGNECCRLQQALPMYARRRDIVQAVEQNQVTIIQGETGSGKSTQLTQYLYQVGKGNTGTIVCTQPRKVAALSLARRVSSELSSGLGGIVGFKAGSKSKAGEETKILYMTDYTLLMECIKDPDLSNYSCIIIDEAHERSLYSDILLAMIKQTLGRRLELKVIISSATMDTKLFSKYFCGFRCSVLKVSGRTYPVQVIWKSGQTDLKSLETNFISCAVDKVIDIHHSEKDGDVLVFLTSGIDAEKACDQLNQKTESKDLQIMQLHGKLQPDEQQKVFEPSEHGKRKVVFATNCAETSLTIPGITYVVDCGLVKERNFDPKRNMSSLDIGLISKSSAEQRKGRAGRIESGKCFRLYSEELFSEMKDSIVPEILRVNLGQAILTLAALNISDPLQFDFVESPARESLEVAMAELVSLGAICDGKLTELGMSISKLPLNPVLGKLVIKGIECNLSMEAVVLAAVCTLSGSMFFRAGSDEEKEKADLKKIPFCQPSGDLLTFLEVYKVWKDIAENRKNGWCKENYINAKSMRVTKDTIGEIKRTLLREVGVQVEDTFQANTDETHINIRRLLFHCFKENLGRFAGHHHVGYIMASNINSEKCHIHPSSALRYLDLTPKWIVFDAVLKTSQNFILNITPVDDAWVMDEINQGAFDFGLSGIEDQVLNRVCISNFGYLLMKDVLPACREWQQTLSTLCDQTPVKLHAKKQEGILEVFSMTKYHDKIKEWIENLLAPKKHTLRLETTARHVPKTKTRVVIGSGCEVTEVLLGNAYSSVVILNVPYHMADSDILDKFQSYGQIKEHKIFYTRPNKARRTWGKIVYSSQTEAAHAVDATKGDEIYARPERTEASLCEKMKRNGLQIKFEWCRRISKGFGFVKFKAIEDACISLRKLTESYRCIGEHAVAFCPSRKNPFTVEIKRLPLSWSENDLKDFLRKYLPVRFEDVEEVVLIREKSYETSERELQNFKLFMQETLSSRLPLSCKDKHQITVDRPNNGSIFIKGRIVFENILDGEAAVECLTDAQDGVCYGPDSHGRRGPVRFTPELVISFFMNGNVFAALEHTIENFGAKVKDEHPSHVQVQVFPPRKRQSACIRITSDKMKDHVKVAAVFQDLVEGDCVVFPEQLMTFLCSNDGRQVLNQVMKDSDAFLYLDRRNKQLRIFGTCGQNTRAKINLNKHFDDFLSEQVHSIFLRGDGRPRGLIRALLKHCAGDLQTLTNEVGCRRASLDIQRSLLKVSGDDGSMERVNNLLKTLSERLSENGFQGAEEADKPECTICLSPFEDYQEMYRLQVCGHPICLNECLKQQIQVAKESRTFPLECGECKEPLTLADISKVVDRRSEAFLDVVRASLEAYVGRNMDTYRFCPGVNCVGVYKVTTIEEAIDLSCETCGFVVCTACHKQHEGMSCEMSRQLKADPDFSLKLYLREDSKNRKACPRCSAPIEKAEGCQHMRCSSCGIHFCWLCLDQFRSSQDCYRHLQHKHGGFF